MTYNLLLDDIRDINDVYKMTHNNIYLSKNWLKAKDFDQFVNIITNCGMPAIISFDHDLAPEHYGLTAINNGENKNGNDCAKWFVNYCKSTNQALPLCYIHSMNPIGAKNIENTLKYF